ncbi:helix-turn-helix domain-containing protein [Tengunoibacter tsumagoiensis]|uniref:HTH cro/C1-type domain-containing protein n=1 Tax=Tengunoibacter tsumagoiensis TaxID=2014871 RepID=A0A402A1Z5_9CHLR|nr:helix-turn-helix transcriptional regulator [Tengunoibacter tsumagoiensis]GCE13178.1 hypothetical protein KTT_30370 [Tengunoibacter tsumagoiensis]
MPRPSKYIPPTTIGGRLRAAREDLHLSLADVAHGQYSTSLISQIERNRIEPSQESLRFLAERLQLSLPELQQLARQSREQDQQNHPTQSYEELRRSATELLERAEISSALHLLATLSFPQIPPDQRWRLAALRGHCYFGQRKFLQAQQDFIYALHEQSTSQTHLSSLQPERMLLHLHLAATYRELRQSEAALEQYYLTLSLISRETPFDYVAEAHWGLALLHLEQAHRLSRTAEEEIKEALHHALKHAENACFLYRSISELRRAAAVTCLIAQIEQELGSIDHVKKLLTELLAHWSPLLVEPAVSSDSSVLEKNQHQEIASIVSSAACSLADIELQAKNYAQALLYVEQALAAAQQSYKLRRAEAYVMLGRVFESINAETDESALARICPSQIEQAFSQAVEELSTTHRIAARISIHVRFGRYLLKIGKIEDGEQQLELARQLSDLVSASNHSSTLLEDVTLL